MMFNNSSLNLTGHYQAVEDKSKRAWMAVFIVLTAIVGHTLVFLAIYRERNLRTIPNFIILNLSVADFLFSAIVPTTHIIRLFRGQTSLKGASCYITGLAGVLFCLVSINTLTFISIERYVATNYPIKYRHRFNFKLMKIVLVSIWCWSTLLSTIPLFTTKYVYIEKFFHCVPDWANDLGTTLTFVILGIALPQIILVCCNVHVVRAIHRNRNVHARSISNSSQHSIQQRHQWERQTCIITVVVVVTFSICWTPYCAAMVCLVRGKCKLSESFMFIALTLTTLNSCCNPIIYGLFNTNFRKAFKNIFCCGK